MLHAATKKIVRHKRLVRREIEEREIEEGEHHEVQVHRTYNNNRKKPRVRWKCKVEKPVEQKI